MIMIKAFIKFGHIEGVSLLILLFIAMPAKYYFHYMEAVRIVGMIHGLLWLTYVVYSLLLSHKLKWSISFWLLTLLTSVTPLGWIFIDRKLNQLKEK